MYHLIGQSRFNFHIYNNREFLYFSALLIKLHSKIIPFTFSPFTVLKSLTENLQCNQKIKADVRHSFCFENEQLKNYTLQSIKMYEIEKILDKHIIRNITYHNKLLEVLTPS